MQGAGHNFGIVSSFELKIYPKSLDTWHYHNYIFTQDKLEPFFEALNDLHNNGSTPVNMGLNIGGFKFDSTIDANEVSALESNEAPDFIYITPDWHEAHV